MVVGIILVIEGVPVILGVIDDACHRNLQIPEIGARTGGGAERSFYYYSTSYERCGES